MRDMRKLTIADISKKDLFKDGIVVTRTELCENLGISLKKLQGIGGYLNILSHFGLNPENKQHKFNNEKINNFKNMCKEYTCKYGRLPYESECVKAKLFGETFSKKFGGYKKMCEFIGYEYSRGYKNKISLREEYKNEYISIYEETPVYSTKLKCDYDNDLISFNYNHIKSLFSTYNDFLKYCGYNTTPKEIETFVLLKEISNFIIDFSNKNNKIPSVTQIVESKICSHKKIGSLGGYRKILKYCGFNSSLHYTSDLTRIDYINLLKEKLIKYDTITYKDLFFIINESNLTISRFLKLFDGLIDVLSECDCLDKTRFKMYEFLTQSDIIVVVTDHFIDKTNPPSKNDFLKSGILTESCVYKLFDGYEDMLVKCGYELKSSGNYSYRTKDKNGNFCRSKEESIVSNFLIDHNIDFEYETKYKDIFDCDRNYRCDFLLYDNTVVEYFGMGNLKSYNIRANNKIKTLEAHNIKYIAIYPKDLKKDNLYNIFKEYVKEV